MARLPTALVAVLSLALLLHACSDDDAAETAAQGGAASTSTASGGAGVGGAALPDSYELPSRFIDGQSAIFHTGQSARHVLIASLTAYVEAMTDAIDMDAFNPPDVATVVSALNYYYAFDDQTSGQDPHGLTTEPPTLQTSFDDVATGKDLQAKMAGNDTVTDHRDWSTAFGGWSDATIAADGGGLTSPELLLTAFFSSLGRLAADRENGIIPFEPGGSTPMSKVYVTPAGQDLKQLIAKFLLMGVAYAQGTDDYLDDDVADKGLLASNAQDGDNPYSVLGHAWDEAFGYFGAARDYPMYTDDEIAAAGGRPDWQGVHDSDGDMAIDLTTEINWGASVNAAKRDRGAVDATDYSGDAFAAFLQGRVLILSYGDTLSDDEREALSVHARAAISAWEKAIAATLVHYINDTIADTQAIDGGAYDFYDHAKHWSELKGFALGMQFNPHKQLSDAELTQLHALIGDAPVLSTATTQQRADYVTSLETARSLLQDAYGFAQANVEVW